MRKAINSTSMQIPQYRLRSKRPPYSKRKDTNVLRLRADIVRYMNTIMLRAQRVYTQIQTNKNKGKIATNNTNGQVIINFFALRVLFVLLSPFTGS